MMRFLLSSLFLLLMFGCDSQGNKNAPGYVDLPVVQPKPLVQIEEVGEDVLSIIGFNTIVLDNGSILIPDLLQVKLFKVNQNGEFIESIGQNGKGPGEFQDISFLSKSPFGNVYVYDSVNRKIVVLDSEGTYSTEFKLPTNTPSGFLVNLSEIRKNQFLMIFRSSQYLFTPGAEQVSKIVIFDKETESFSGFSEIKSRLYAERTGGGAGTVVPYAPTDLITFDPATGKPYVFWTGEKKIAQLDSNLDTTKIISVNLESELLSDEEADSAESQNAEYWDAMKDLLPEYKAFADEMMIDHRSNFWLKLNHRSEHQRWLVASSEGKLLQIVELPKDVLLTHISEDHLGVRLDDNIFALFESPDFD